MPFAVSERSRLLISVLSPQYCAFFVGGSVHTSITRSPRQLAGRSILFIRVSPVATESNRYCPCSRASVAFSPFIMPYPYWKSGPLTPASVAVLASKPFRRSARICRPWCSCP